MDPLSDGTAERLRACIATWESWGTALTSAPLPIWQYGGYSNETFLVTDNHTRLVLRLNGEAERFGVDRDLEAGILSGLADQPWVPTLIHRDMELDFLVTEYIHGTQVTSADLAFCLADVGRLFGEIHRLDLNIETRLDPVDQARYYLDQLSGDLPASLIHCHDRILSRMPSPPSAYCLCHHDLLPENILDTPSGPVALDWEYASLGVPAFDLAVFIEGCQLNEAAQRSLLDTYRGPASLEDIDGYRDLYRLIEILWWLLKDADAPHISAGLAELERRLV